MSFRYVYVIRGRAVAKKNSHRVRSRQTPKGRRSFVGNSAEYLAWAKDAAMQLRVQRGAVPTIDKKVRVHADVVVYLAYGQRLDGDNALGGPFDVLQEAGVITNDAKITSHACRVERDWDNPRVELVLTPASAASGGRR